MNKSTFHYKTLKFAERILISLQSRFKVGSGHGQGDSGIKAEPPSSTEGGSAFFSPQLPQHLHKEIPDLLTSSPHRCLPHLLFNALIAIEIISFI